MRDEGVRRRSPDHGEQCLVVVGVMLRLWKEEEKVLIAALM